VNKLLEMATYHQLQHKATPQLRVFEKSQTRII